MWERCGSRLVRVLSFRMATPTRRRQSPVASPSASSVSSPGQWRSGEQQTLIEDELREELSQLSVDAAEGTELLSNLQTALQNIRNAGKQAGWGMRDGLPPPSPSRSTEDLIAQLNQEKEALRAEREALKQKEKALLTLQQTNSAVAKPSSNSKASATPPSKSTVLNSDRPRSRLEVELAKAQKSTAVADALASSHKEVLSALQAETEEGGTGSPEKIKQYHVSVDQIEREHMVRWANSEEGQSATKKMNDEYTELQNAHAKILQENKQLHQYVTAHNTLRQKYVRLKEQYKARNAAMFQVKRRQDDAWRFALRALQEKANVQAQAHIENIAELSEQLGNAQTILRQQSRVADEHVHDALRESVRKCMDLENFVIQVRKENMDLKAANVDLKEKLLTAKDIGEDAVKHAEASAVERKQSTKTEEKKIQWLEHGNKTLQTKLDQVSAQNDLLKAELYEHTKTIDALGKGREWVDERKEMQTHLQNLQAELHNLQMRAMQSEELQQQYLEEKIQAFQRLDEANRLSEEYKELVINLRKDAAKSPPLGTTDPGVDASPALLPRRASAQVRDVFNAAVSMTLAKDLRQVFDAMDASGDGLLSLEDLQIGLDKMSIHLDEVELHGLWDSLDVDRDKKITYSDFENFCVCRQRRKSIVTLAAEKAADRLVRRERRKSVVDEAVHIGSITSKKRSMHAKIMNDIQVVPSTGRAEAVRPTSTPPAPPPAPESSTSAPALPPNNLKSDIVATEVRSVFNTAVSMNYAKDLHQVFKVLDKSDDGRLSLDELKNGLKKVSIPVNDEELRQLWRALDVDGDGNISLSEFQNFCMNRKAHLGVTLVGERSRKHKQFKETHKRAVVEAASVGHMKKKKRIIAGEVAKIGLVKSRKRQVAQETAKLADVTARRRLIHKTASVDAARVGQEKTLKVLAASHASETGADQVRGIRRKQSPSKGGKRVENTGQTSKRRMTVARGSVYKEMGANELEGFDDAKTTSTSAISLGLISGLMPKAKPQRRSHGQRSSVAASRTKHLKLRDTLKETKKSIVALREKKLQTQAAVEASKRRLRNLKKQQHELSTNTSASSTVSVKKSPRGTMGTASRGLVQSEKPKIFRPILLKSKKSALKASEKSLSPQDAKGDESKKTILKAPVVKNPSQTERCNNLAQKASPNETRTLGGSNLGTTRFRQTTRQKTRVEAVSAVVAQTALNGSEETASPQLSKALLHSPHKPVVLQHFATTIPEVSKWLNEGMSPARPRPAYKPYVGKVQNDVKTGRQKKDPVAKTLFAAPIGDGEKSPGREVQRHKPVFIQTKTHATKLKIPRKSVPLSTQPRKKNIPVKKPKARVPESKVDVKLKSSSRPMFSPERTVCNPANVAKSPPPPSIPPRLSSPVLSPVNPAEIDELETDLSELLRGRQKEKQKKKRRLSAEPKKKHFAFLKKEWSSIRVGYAPTYAAKTSTKTKKKADHRLSKIRKKQEKIDKSIASAFSDTHQDENREK